MTKQTQIIQPLLNWVIFPFYKPSTIGYKLFLQNKPKILRFQSKYNGCNKNKANVDQAALLHLIENAKQTHFFSVALGARSLSAIALGEGGWQEKQNKAKLGYRNHKKQNEPKLKVAAMKIQNEPKLFT